MSSGLMMRLAVFAGPLDPHVYIREPDPGEVENVYELPARVVQAVLRAQEELAVAQADVLLHLIVTGQLAPETAASWISPHIGLT